MPRSVAGSVNREHHGHFDQNTYYRCQRRSGIRPKEGNRRCHGKLEKVRSSNERSWSCYGVLDFSHFINP